MLATKLKIVSALAIAVAVIAVGTGVVAKGNGQDTKAQAYALAQPADNDEPKKKDEPKEEEKGFLGIRFEGGDEGEDHPTVASVVEDSPAAKAGIKDGDVILKIGDKDAKGIQATVALVQALKPGQKVTVKVSREKKEMDIKVTIGKRPPDESLEQQGCSLDQASIEELLSCWENG